MKITATYTSHLSGIATGLPTKLNHTLHTTIKELPTDTAVVCLDGLDAAVPDTSKYNLVVMFLPCNEMKR